MMKNWIPVLILLLMVPLAPVQKTDREEIFENNVWKQLHAEYRPDDGLIDVLKSKVSAIDAIDIYFAFWCGDSENNVPQFIKILDSIGALGLKVNYFKADRKKPGEKFYFEKLKVERVPTFIFFKEGKELGRIIENPKKSLEEDSLEILF